MTKNFAHPNQPRILVIGMSAVLKFNLRRYMREQFFGKIQVALQQCVVQGRRISLHRSKPLNLKKKTNAYI